MKRTIRIAAMFVIAFSFTGCSTLNVNKTRLSSIKKVAVTGFLVAQEMPKGFNWKLLGMKNDNGTMPAWGPGLPKPSEHSNDMYARLGKALKGDLKWTVIDRNAVASNPAYQQLHARFMKGLQSRPPLTASMEAFGADGVIDPYPIEHRLSGDERRALMKSLGVDAIAVATVRIQLEKAGGLKNLIGAGDYKPKAEIAFAVYDTKGDEPVWKDLQAVGEVVEEGAEHVFGITDMKTLMKQTIQAAANSYDKLLARYRQQEG